MRKRLWPGSLAGQLVLLIAIALFVAQAINFGLLLQERRTLRLAQIVSPAVTRIVDATDRTSHGRGPVADRGRIRRLPANPITTSMPRQPAIEAGLRQGLADAGLRVGRIATGVRPFTGGGRRLRRRVPESELVIAVEQPGQGWLVQRLPWPRSDAYLIWRLIGQTLILYGIVLIPVLWITRRIARPLRALTLAAEGFSPGDDSPAVGEAGPRDVRALIAAFNALRLRVTAMLDEKDRMLGAIGHDLRTPLAALRVRIESVEDDADRMKMADTIAEMNRTLDDILSLARLGRPSEPPTDVDLPALVDAVVEDFRDLDCDVRFVDSDRLTMHLRPSLMRRAVRNLIENAIKYGLSAEVRVEPRSDGVAIVVADQGPGIPPARLADVFAPFTRLETSRNRETGGIGLGLALARAIVREAGGEIMLVNRAGNGLDATILLPRQTR